MTLLDDTRPLIVSAVCDVIGAIGRLKPILIDECDKSSLVKKLLSISFNSSILSKVKFNKIENKKSYFTYLFYNIIGQK